MEPLVPPACQTACREIQLAVLCEVAGEHQAPMYVHLYAAAGAAVIIAAARVFTCICMHSGLSVSHDLLLAYLQAYLMRTGLVWELLPAVVLQPGCCPV